MFGNMMQDMEKKQAELQESLKTVMVSSSVENGKLTVTSNALRQITQIHIDPSLLSGEFAEQIEDLLIIAINDCLEKAAVIEAEKGKSLISDILPPGLKGMLGG